MRKPRRRAFSPLPRPSLCILADFFRSNSRVGYDSGRRSRWGERLREGAAAREREEAIDVIGASDSRHSFFARRAHEIVIIPCASCLHGVAITIPKPLKTVGMPVFKWKHSSSEAWCERCEPWTGRPLERGRLPSIFTREHQQWENREAWA